MRKKILLVDDDESIRDAVGGFLATFYNVFEARNGEEALQLIERNLNPDLIITDYCMPKMNAQDLISQLASQERSFPMICLTGQGSTDVYRDLWVQGVFEYLEKPFSLPELLKKASTAISLNADIKSEREYRRLYKKMSFQKSK